MSSLSSVPVSLGGVARWRREEKRALETLADRLLPSSSSVLPAGAAALSVSSSPEARFASTDASVESRSQATVLSHHEYAALKHEEAEKAVKALHLPGDNSDNLLAGLNAQSEEDEAIDLAGEENEAELLSLAAETVSDAD